MMNKSNIEIRFQFCKGISEDIKQFVCKELEYILPYLRKIVPLFYDVSWGPIAGEDENRPEIMFTMPFRQGMLVKGALPARLFEFTLYTDSSESFELSVCQTQTEICIARTDLKFADWLNVE
jgi:hypothetical protein